MEDKLLNEIDQLILSCIVRLGYEALPLSLRFLEQYNLKEYYYFSVNMNMQYSVSALPDKNKFFIEMANRYISPSGISELSAYYETNGENATRKLLLGVPLYYERFIREYKKSKSKNY